METYGKRGGGGAMNDLLAVPFGALVQNKRGMAYG